MSDETRPKPKGREPITPFRFTPADLAMIDELVTLLGSTSRADAVREAVRRTLRNTKKTRPKDA